MNDSDLRMNGGCSLNHVWPWENFWRDVATQTFPSSLAFQSFNAKGLMVHGIVFFLHSNEANFLKSNILIIRLLP